MNLSMAKNNFPCESRRVRDIVPNSKQPHFVSP